MGQESFNRKSKISNGAGISLKRSVLQNSALGFWLAAS
jgi:hypothetical protein